MIEKLLERVAFFIHMLGLANCLPFLGVNILKTRWCSRIIRKCNPMDEQEIDRFSWSGLFFVTSVCSFLFSLAIRLMDGKFSIWLLIIGGVAGLLGILSWAIGALDRQYAKKRRDKRFAS